MDYKDARIVLFPFQFGVEVIDDLHSLGWTLLPPLVLQRLRLHSQGETVHLKQGGIEKRLTILPFFKKKYEHIMGEDLRWKDPTLCFVHDIDVMIQNTRDVFWIFASPEIVQELSYLLLMVTSDIHVYHCLLESQVINAVSLEFPNNIAIA